MRVSLSKGNQLINTIKLFLDVLQSASHFNLGSDVIFSCHSSQPASFLKSLRAPRLSVGEQKCRDMGRLNNLSSHNTCTFAFQAWVIISLETLGWVADWLNIKLFRWSLSISRPCEIPWNVKAGVFSISSSLSYKKFSSSPNPLSKNVCRRKGVLW